MKSADTQATVSRRNFVRAALLGCAGLTSRVFGADTSGSLLVDPRMRRLAADAPLAMQFRGESASDAREWQRVFRTQLETLLGSYRPPKQWDSVLERTVELPDHIREERLLTATGRDPVPVYLLRPRGATTGKRAGILAIHGHGMGYDTIAGRDETPALKAELERFRYDYGLQLARRGYVVVAPCLTPFGRRLATDITTPRGDACEVTQLRLLMLGRNLMTENLRDCLWAFEFLIAQPDVHRERLGCVGLSLGGRMTMLTTAVEPRLKVAVMAGSLNCLQERVMSKSVGGCQTIPGLLNFGDVPEIAGLIAPRPILWTVGDRDKLIDKGWAEKALARIRRVYRALGAENDVAVHEFSGGHEWNGEKAYPLLDRVLTR
ncbi:MAG: alpha/beta hydrolase family protein [Verrucomicrobiota bacterium]